MIVDVSWDGVKLAEGTQAREEPGGWFVELEQPMPVGTRLRLDGEAQADVRVARVHEGLGAGMLVKPEGALPAATKPTENALSATSGASPAATGASAAATDAGATSAPESAAAKPADGAAADGDGKEPDDGGGNGGAKRDRRRKKKPTG